MQPATTDVPHMPKLDPQAYDQKSLVGPSIRKGTQVRLMHAAALADKAGDLSSALRQLTSAHALAPTCVAIMERLASVCLRLDLPGEAMEWVDRALAIDDKNVGVLNVLAVLHREQGRPEEALCVLEQALRLATSAQTPNLEIARSACLRDMGRDEEALAALLRVAHLFPRRAEVWNELGCIHHAHGNPGKASRLFDVAVSLEPGDATYLVNRAAARADCGALRQALDDYDAVLCLSPSDPDALVGRAIVRHRLGSFIAAQADVEAALEVDRSARGTSCGQFSPDAMGERMMAIQQLLNPIELCASDLHPSRQSA